MRLKDIWDQERGVSERVEYWLNMFRLENKRDMVIRKLSGGEKRRVQIAERCAIEDYQMMICDEPDTGLDLVTQAQLHKMLCRGAKQNNKALITVTHNLYKNMFEYDMLLGRGASENTATIRYFGKPAYLSRVFGTEDLLEIFKQLYKPAKRVVEPKKTEKRRNLVTI